MAADALGGMAGGPQRPSKELAQLGSTPAPSPLRSAGLQRVPWTLLGGSAGRLAGGRRTSAIADGIPEALARGGLRVFPRSRSDSCDSRHGMLSILSRVAMLRFSSVLSLRRTCCLPGARNELK